MGSKSTIYVYFSTLVQNAKQFLLMLLLCGSFFSYAQTPYYNQLPEFLKANSVWAWGSYAGLDFNNGGPAPIRTAIQTLEGSASVADRVTGKLLFYSNGGQVWNVNHRIMPNGDSLLGNAKNVGGKGYGNYSTRQGVCIVPVIGDPDKYYLFSLRGESSGGSLPEGTLFYNIVDMKLDNGLGDIVPGKKNIALDRDYLSESIVTVPGDNCDIWLIVHTAGTNEFKSYHITKDGIDTTPVVSSTNKGLYNYMFGAMAISPDRSKIVVTAFTAPRTAPPAGALIAPFDPATGTIANEGIIYGRHYRIQDVCFSPDNSKLYISGAAFPGSGAVAGIGQLDLAVFDSAAIANSLVSISTKASSTPFKIYNDTIYFCTSNYVSRINKPNLPGIACNIQEQAITFNISSSDSLYLHSALNTDVVFPLPPDTIHALALDTLVCPTEFTLSAPKEFEGYVWDDGSTSLNRNITGPGTYWVLYKDYCHYRMDTFIISGMDLTPPVITVNIRTLGAVASYTSYQWMLDGDIIPGATDSTYTAIEDGEYQVIVTNEIGCTDTSEIYLITNTGLSDRFTLREQIFIYPNPATHQFYIDAPVAVNIRLTDLAGKLVKETVSAKVMTVSELPNGIYLLHISDKKGVLLKTEKLVKAE